MLKTIVTDRGQISIPAALRREMQLTPGKFVLWEKVSATECRLVVEPPTAIQSDPVAAIGFAKRHGFADRTTAEWMKILREGEED